MAAEAGWGTDKHELTISQVAEALGLGTEQQTKPKNANKKDDMKI